MIVFENDGEIDPRLAMMFGVNVKEKAGAIGFFGTGLKYAIACMARWGETMVIHAGENEFNFSVEATTFRDKVFEAISMHSKYDRAQLAFTTELGKRWEPWMVYRELWCNAFDEPNPRVWVTDQVQRPVAGKTRIYVDGAKIAEAHETRNEFILNPAKTMLCKTPGVEIYRGEGPRIFYRGIAVQTPTKAGLYTYNITEQMYLTEDRTAGSWQTDPIIAKALAQLDDREIISATIAAPEDRLESRLDYCYVTTPGDVWNEIAEKITAARPMSVPTSVRSRFIKETVAKVCPTCQRPMDDEVEMPF